MQEDKATMAVPARFRLPRLGGLAGAGATAVAIKLSSAALNFLMFVVAAMVTDVRSFGLFSTGFRRGEPGLLRQHRRPAKHHPALLAAACGGRQSAGGLRSAVALDPDRLDRFGGGNSRLRPRQHAALGRRQHSRMAAALPERGLDGRHARLVGVSVQHIPCPRPAVRRAAATRRRLAPGRHPGARRRLVDLRTVCRQSPSP